MTRHVARIRMAKPTLLDRLWYWKIRQDLPLGTGSSRHIPTEKWARLVPYRWRRFHQQYAGKHRFYWLPCPLCDRPHGGHEGGKTIPDPIQGPPYGVVICSRCSRNTPTLRSDW